MPQTTDRNRFLKFNNPLDDNLILHHFSGHEKLGNLFEFHLDLLSEDNNIDLSEILGKTISAEMETEDPDKKRFFHGYVTEFRYVGVLNEYARYQATVKPWLWFLSRTSDCRIFQNKSIPDIIKEVFADNGWSGNYELKLNKTYQPWEYCVQYRETDLNFVSRLMEQEGIYYFFKHETAKHTLVLADHMGAHVPNPDYAEIKFFPPTENGIREEDHIYDWAAGREIIPDEVVLDDYDFLKPNVDLTQKSKTLLTQQHPGGQQEVYDYPGEYSETAAGQEYAKTRMFELETRFHRARGIGNTRGIAAGFLFDLTQFPRDDQNVEYLVISVSHDIKNDAAVTTAASGGEISYTCQFEVMPKVIGTGTGLEYKSPRITPKPIVQGPQTAVVVGKSGEEIWTDQHGRIKVQFHWDRQGEKDENTTCYIRVATSWAGQNWGAIHIPRIGQEVVVSFLEGDPDRPLVTGSVYNANHMPPYTLPDNQTQSGIKSRSTKEGTDKNFNEIRFEDKKDSEEFRTQAEKDMNVGVKHIRKTFIGASLDDAGTGKRDDGCPDIGKMNEQLTVFADRETFIKGNDTLQIAEEGAASKGRCMTVHNGNHELTVKTGDQKTDINQGNKTTTIDTGNQTTTVKTGNYTLDVEMGKVTITAMQSIELKVGSSSIKLDQTSITLKSLQINVQAEAMATVKGAMVEVNGSGTAIVKGGLVMIN